MLKAILFDLDNTLVNFWKFKKDSANAAARAMVEAGLPISQKDCYDRIFLIYKKHGVEYQLTFTELLAPLELRPLLKAKIRDAGVAAYKQCKKDMLKPYPGMPETLTALKNDFGLRLGVLTDAPRAQAHARLDFTGLQNHFEAVGTFHDTHALKPAAAPFLHICQKMNVEPSDVMMVGDNPARDIAGAHSLGMKTCLAKYDPYLGNTGPAPDFSIDEPKELLDIVGKLLGG